eukprot:293240-Pyramimonas_sp.AAC.1
MSIWYTPWYTHLGRKAVSRFEPLDCEGKVGELVARLPPPVHGLRVTESVSPGIPVLSRARRVAVLDASK